MTSIHSHTVKQDYNVADGSSDSSYLKVPQYYAGLGPWPKSASGTEFRNERNAKSAVSLRQSASTHTSQHHSICCMLYPMVPYMAPSTKPEPPSAVHGPQRLPLNRRDVVVKHIMDRWQLQRFCSISQQYFISTFDALHGSGFLASLHLAAVFWSLASPSS